MSILPHAWRKRLRKVPLLRSTYRVVRNSCAYAGFVLFARAPLSMSERISLLRRLRRVTRGIECAHTEGELLTVIDGIMALGANVGGDVVEAGCYKGGSTAKFSLICRQVGRKLHAFDSFEGIPANDDPHDRPAVFGHSSHFPEGSYAGSFEEVTSAVQRFGDPSVVEYYKGWFDDTMPHFRAPLAAAYIDVDLPSSTRTCIKFLYPLLSPGGLLFSQDAHLPPVTDVFEDENFWRNEIGVEKPKIEYSHHRAILWVRKPLGSRELVR